MLFFTFGVGYLQIRKGGVKTLLNLFIVKLINKLLIFAFLSVIAIFYKFLCSLKIRYLHFCKKFVSHESC